MTQREAATDAASWSRGLSEEFILCRDYGHSWRPVAVRFDIDEQAWRRRRRCARCGTERAELVSQRGEMLGASYVYPQGYQRPAGSGYLDGDARAQLRLESTMRLVAMESD